MNEFNHFNTQGHAKMVDVSNKSDSFRTALAEGYIYMNAETLSMIKSGGSKKGDVLGCAQIAGIMAAKKTSDIIPMCHPLSLSGVNIQFECIEENPSIHVLAEVTCSGNTGVEMEALTAVSVSLLTIYDMTKALQKDMVIENICLLKKTGGKSGEFIRKDVQTDEI